MRLVQRMHVDDIMGIIRVLYGWNGFVGDFPFLFLEFCHSYPAMTPLAVMLNIEYQLEMLDSNFRFINE